MSENMRVRCTCGETACESELCDCDAVPCPVNHRAEEAEAERDALKAELAEAKRVMAAQPKPSHVEELRDHIVEILGDPDETTVEAFLSFASAEVARIAGGEMVARWKAEDELAEARAAIEQAAAHVREWMTPGAPVFSPKHAAEVDALLRKTLGERVIAALNRDDTLAALDAPQRPEDIAEGSTEHAIVGREAFGPSPVRVVDLLKAPQRPEDTREETGRG